MGVRNQNWYNLQSTRRYPLDELSTGYDDDGQLIRDDIIVDCNVLFPKTLGSCVYVQGITVSAGIVSVVFGIASAAGEISGQTIAYAAAPQPVSPNINYDIVGTVPGVSGWITFGSGIDTPFTGRYSNSVQTAVLPRCARGYKTLPVPSIRKNGVAAALDGLVKVLGQSPIVATKETITVDNRNYPAIVLRLNKKEITADFNVFSRYLGPCAQRPESGTCAKPGIESINGIEPDCNGNINIIVNGFDVSPFSDCGGIEIISDEPLPDLCVAAKADPPDTFADKCCVAKYEVADTAARDEIASEDRFAGLIVKTIDTGKRWTLNADLLTWEENTTTEDDCAWPDPGTAIPDLIVEELPEQILYPCVTYPVCADLNACNGETPQFETKAGVFATQQTLAPPVCPGCSSESPGTTFSVHNTYAATDPGGLNIAVFKNCASDWAINKAISVEFKISGNGVERNGGLALNYLKYLVETGAGNTRVQTTFIAIVADIVRGQFRVLHYENGVYDEIHSTAMRVKTDTWYKISAVPVLNGNSIFLSTTIENLTTPAQASISLGVQIAANIYGTLSGQAGLFSSRAYTYFNKLKIENA
jgi:hypothetical protein